MGCGAWYKSSAYTLGSLNTIHVGKIGRKANGWCKAGKANYSKCKATNKYLGNAKMG